MHTRKSFGRRRLRKLPAVALTAAALAVLPAVPALADTPAVAPAVTGADFYTPPANVGVYANGAIIKYEDSAVAYLGVPAKRIMYRSNDVNNQPVAVTGTLLQATAPWRGPGARPLVSYAVGTIGQGDQCAPSKLFNQGLEYEAAPLFPMLAAGVDVVVTDYEGLGDPTRVHTYVNRVDEANAVLDAAIAAKKLGAMGVPGVDVPAAGKVGIYGYSQGGGAAAAATELQHAYAPSLDSLLVGTAAGAPPADLAKVAENIDGGSLAGAFGYTINGLIQDYPEITKADTPGNIYSLLNDQGKNVLAATAGECVAETALRFASSTPAATPRAVSRRPRSSPIPNCRTSASSTPRRSASSAQPRRSTSGRAATMTSSPSGSPCSWPRTGAARPATPRCSSRGTTSPPCSPGSASATCCPPCSACPRLRAGSTSD